jgi:hypothetical protein
MSQFELRPCTVCGLLDGDYRPKKVSYCSVCDVWLCQKDVGDVVRRAVAAYKRQKGKLRKEWDKLKNLTFMGYGDEWSVVDDAGGGVLFVEQAIVSAATTVIVATNADFGTSATTVVATIAGGVASGHGAVAFAFSNGNTTTLSSCTDNASTPNTYTVDENGSVTNTTDGFVAYVCSAFMVNPIPAAGHITMTFNAACNAHVVVFDVNKFASSSWLDVKGQNTNTFVSTLTATASGPQLGNPEVVLALCEYGTTATTSNITSGYTSLQNNTQWAANSRWGSSAWKETSSGTPAQTTTIGTGDDLVVVVLAYKES